MGTAGYVDSACARYGSSSPSAVDVHVAAPDLDGLAAQSDDPLDQVVGVSRLARLVEHDHIAPVDVVQAVPELVHHHPVADYQGGLH